MILENINIIGNSEQKYIKTKENLINKISNVSPPAEKEGLHINFENAIAFPGLINSHDHLEFNLFPKLGNAVYRNYLEWGSDIFRQNRNVIDTVTRVPKKLRAEWGVYKNLLNGITTVVHHGEYFDLKETIIDVFQDCHSLHSVRLEKNWKTKLNKPFITKQPFVIHIGEGTDTGSSNEVNELIKWNLLKRKLIGVHGISMNEQQASSFEALVWCPDSNYFLYNATVRADSLKSKTKIVFGTDSTVSASWNLWEHLRLAKETKMLTDQELLDSISSTPADLWNLKDKGILAEGKVADIVVARMKAETDTMSSFFNLNPVDILLVLKKGEVIYFDETLYLQIKENVRLKDFSKLYVENNGKYIKGDAARLMADIKKITRDINFPVQTDQG